MLHCGAEVVTFVGWRCASLAQTTNSFIRIPHLFMHYAVELLTRTGPPVGNVRPLLLVSWERLIEYSDQRGNLTVVLHCCCTVLQPRCLQAVLGRVELRKSHGALYMSPGAKKKSTCTSQYTYNITPARYVKEPERTLSSKQLRQILR